MILWSIFSLVNSPTTVTAHACDSCCHTTLLHTWVDCRSQLDLCITLTYVHAFSLQLLYERSGLSERTLTIFNKQLVSVLKEPLRNGREFWDATKTLQTMREKEYFTRDGDDVSSAYPAVLRDMIADGGSVLRLAFSYTEEPRTYSNFVRL